jgi:tRNA pseudouridine38-40 synthase
VTTRFRMTVEYDGRNLVGFQRQNNGPSVQGALERAVLSITGEAVTVVGSGRTDAGVHATGQVAHVDIEKSIAPERLMAALNAHLRADPIAVLACDVAPDDFHARFSATQRHYRYVILNRRAPLTFQTGLAWRVPQPLDANAMHRSAQQLVGKHDFTTFRSVHCQAASPVKTLNRLDVQRSGEVIEIAASARSFLHHQVRSMVGCLKLVGQGLWTEAQLGAALTARNRAALGLNAPPDGLTLVGVDYGEMA